jgi:NAD(P)-dependent dehydrogenase (short-subunit alcohol dehydrogenase family)
MGKLEGKVALVTGSGRNIGRATVLKLASEGAHVVVNARSNQQEAEAVAREVRNLGVKAVPILADVGKKAEVEALATKALSEFGRVDILINNAAIRPHKPFTETTDADWELVRSVPSSVAARFVADSPVEQRRFELMVPPRTPAFRGRHMGPATAGRRVTSRVRKRLSAGGNAI